MLSHQPGFVRAKLIDRFAALRQWRDDWEFAMSDSSTKTVPRPVTELEPGVTIMEQTPTSITLHFASPKAGGGRDIVETRRPHTVRSAGFKLSSAG